MRKILIVDDNRLNLRILEDILTEANYEVHSLSDGMKVVQTATAYMPDAIFLDLIMPGQDGFCVCDHLRENDRTKNIPVIIMTSLAGTIHLNKAFESGAFDYIRKPFDKMEVLARLKSALRFYDQHKLLEQLAMRDGLTDLYNHRYSMEYLEKGCCHAKSHGNPVSFMMLDIDFFKSVNDTFGHKAGDLILQEVSRLLQQSLADHGLVGRYGGEEFCILLHDKSLHDVRNIAEDIRKQIATYEFCISQDQTLNITLSIGVAHAESNEKKQSSLLVDFADHALYQAKESGRNKVICQTV